VKRAFLLAPALLLTGCSCSSGGTETTERTTTVQVTTTVEAAPTVETTTGPSLPSNDPDDVDGQLDVRNFNATRTGELLAVSLTTYEAWNSSVLAGPQLGRAGPNRLTIVYDVDLDGTVDYRGKVIWAEGALSLMITGEGQAFEPVPVERPDDVTAQFVHPVDVFFIPSGGSSDVDIQLQARTVYDGEQDKAPDDGQWLGVPFNP
jgi:hypothetical protein